jgi:hypothetical protein
MITTMRAVLALGLSIALCISADAASARRTRVRSHLHVGPGEGVTAPAAPGAAGHFAVSGWSDEDTRRWLDGAGSLWRGA